MKFLLEILLVGITLAASASPSWQGAVLLHTDHGQQPVERAQAEAERVQAMSWQTKGFYICSGLLVLVLCCFSCAGAKPVHLEPTSQEDVEKMRAKIKEEDEKLDEDWKRIEASMETPEDKQKALDEHENEPLDYDKMLQTVFKTASDQVGNKMAKEGAVRRILENRMNNFAGKAKSFMLSKMNVTASDLMKAVDEEEGLLLLEWNQAVEANFPPASVVIAGLLSPLMLTLSVLNHLSQGLFLFLPVTILCIASLYIDHGVPCPGIPGMNYWLYVHTFLAAVLFIAHTMQLTKIALGKRALSKKAEQVGAKLKEIESHEEQGIADMQQQFVGRSVLIQQALLIEDDCRRSPSYFLVGILTLIWMLTLVWTFVIVIGWTFVPGVAAFHAAAQATAGNAFCGTWMTVLTARLCSIMGLLFLLINAITVARWFVDTLTHSDQFEKKLLKQAKRFDDAAGGIPICQILAKAFVLRGSTDTVYAKLNVCVNEEIFLGRKKQELEDKKKALEEKLKSKEQHLEALDQKVSNMCEGDSGFGGIIKQLEKGDSANWKQKGVEAIQQAESRVSSGEEANTEELDRLVERVNSTVESIRNSDEFKEAAEASKQYAEETARKAKEFAEQAAEAAAQAAEAAAKKLEEAKNSEQVQAALQKGAEVAQQAVEKGAEVAQQAVEKGTEVAQEVKKKASEVDVEALKAQGKEALDKTVEAGKKAVEDASSTKEP